MRKTIALIHRASISIVLGYAAVCVFMILYLQTQPLGFLYVIVTVAFLTASRFLLSPPQKLSREFVLVMATLAWCTLAIVVQYVSQKEYFDEDGRSSYYFTLVLLISNTVWFFAGMMVSGATVKTNNLLGLIIICLLALLVGSRVGDSFFILYSALSEDENIRFDHIFVMERLLLICFFAYSVLSGRIRVLVLPLIAAILFAGGGRTEFYLGFGSVLAYEFIVSSGRARLAYAATLVVASFVGVLQLANVSDQALLRMLFFAGLEADMSYQARAETFGAGWVILSDQFLFGNPGLIIREHGTLGAYIHNLLSAWQFFGFIPFAFLVILLLRIAPIVLRSTSSNNTPIDVFGIVCFAYGLLGIVFTKYIGFAFLWFGLGFWVYRLNFLSGNGRRF